MQTPARFRFRVRDMKEAHILLGVALIGLALAITWTAYPWDRTAALLFDRVNYIQAGDKFDVAIGMEIAPAAAVLVKNGWDQMHPALVVNHCVGRQPTTEQSVIMFFDRTWRNGSMCLVEEDGKVRAIGWAFVPLTP